MRREKKNVACLKIHVLEEARPSAFTETRIEDTPRVICTRDASHILGFCMKFGRFLPKPNTQDCVRRRMLPPALGGLRVLRAAGPGLFGSREYGKDQLPCGFPQDAIIILL